MGHRLIGAACLALFLAHRQPAAQAGRIRIAQRQVTGGVFIEERVVKQQAGSGDRRILRNERDFSQIAAALVKLDQRAQRCFSLTRVISAHFAILKFQMEILDQLTVVIQRLARMNDAVGLQPVRHGEHFFRRQVGVEADAVLRLFASPFPQVPLRQADRKICSQRAGEVQRGKPAGVEAVHPLFEHRVALFPDGERIMVRVDIDTVKDGLPQLLYAVFAGIREHLIRPAGVRHGHDAPGADIVHRVFLHRLARPGPGQTGRTDLCGVTVRKHPRCLTDHMEHARPFFQIVQTAVDLPVMDPAQRLFILVQVMQAADALIAVAHHHFSRTHAVRLLTDQRGKVSGLHIRIHHHCLPLLHIDAAGQRQARIFPFQQFQFIHHPFLHLGKSIPQFSRARHPGSS